MSRGKMSLIIPAEEKELDKFFGTEDKNNKKPWQAMFPCNEDEEKIIREGFKTSTSKKISDYLKKIVLDYHNFQPK